MPDPSLTHTMPQSKELEVSLLSRLFFEPQEMDTASDLLSPSDFYSTANRKIYDVFLSLHNQGKPVDIGIVVEDLRAKRELEAIGGATYLSKIIETPIAISVEHTCRKIAEKAGLRRVIEVCSHYTAKAFEDRGDAVSLIDGLQRDITKIDIDGGGDDVEKIDVLMNSYLDDLEKLSQRGVNVTGFPTGFRLLDYITCGWQGSDLIIIAARPSIGKTSLALRLAMNMGAAGIPGLLFNLEMSKKQVTMRMAAMTSGVDAQKMRNAKLSPDEWERLSRAAGKVSDMPIWVHDQPSMHYNQIRRIARRHYKTNGIKYIFIDHLQLCRGDFPKEPFHDTGSITGPLKALAKELNIPVFVLSQLNRDLEKRSNKRPIMADLRNSGNIEQDADIVMFIYRDEHYYEDTPNIGVAEIDISKQRNGPTGMMRTHFQSHCMDFKELQQ